MPLVKILDIVVIIIDQYQKCKSFLEYFQSYGVAALADSALLGLAVTTLSVKSDDIILPSVYHPNPHMTCFNCAKKGHSATECRAPRKFHPGVKCADKMDCFKKNRAATKKEKS